MKKVICFLTLLFLISLPVLSLARIYTVGAGDKIAFDPKYIPHELKGAFDIMNSRCIQCHTQERTVVAIQTGIAPVTGQPFDKNATKTYGVKMLRKPKSNMSREEVKQVVSLLNYLLDQAAKQ